AFPPVASETPVHTQEFTRPAEGEYVTSPPLSRSSGSIQSYPHPKAHPDAGHSVAWAGCAAADPSTACTSSEIRSPATADGKRSTKKVSETPLLVNSTVSLGPSLTDTVPNTRAIPRLSVASARNR